MKYLKIAIGVILSATVLTLLTTAILSARQSARLTQWKNNYKQIGLALHNYHDTHNTLPPGGVFRADGTPLQGWMWSISPFLDDNPFYQRTNIDLPWDDPKILGYYFHDYYRSSNFYSSSPKPSFRGPMSLSNMAANSWIMHHNSSVSLNDIDDQANTMLVADSSEPYDVFGSTYNWRDPELERNSGPRSFGNIFPDVTLVLLADGRIEILKVPLTDHKRWKTLRGPEKLRPTPENTNRPTGPWELGNRPHDPIIKYIPGQGK